MSAPNSNEYQQYGNYPPPSVPIGPGGIGHLPPPEKKKSHKGAIIATVVAVVALLIGVGIGTSSAKTDAAGAAGSTNTVTTVTEQGAPGAPGATVTETETATVQQTVEKTIIPKPVVKTVEKTATVKVTAGPPPAEFIDGTNIVGVDVQPGTYQSKNSQCYWERLSGTSGTMDDVIANGNGAIVVTIDASDKAFTSQDCEPWKKVG